MNFFWWWLIYEALLWDVQNSIATVAARTGFCTFVQSATESAAQASGSYHTKEVTDRRILAHCHRCETPSSSLQSSKYSIFGLRVLKTGHKYRNP